MATHRAGQVDVSCSHNVNVHKARNTHMLCFITNSTLCGTHSVPLVADVLGGEVGVRVDAGELDAVGLSDLQDLAVDAHGGHALLVGLGQRGLELVVSGDQALWRRTSGR